MGIVERLRERASAARSENTGTGLGDALHFEEAADLIERLRKALKRWQYSGCPDCRGDCGSANPPVMCCIMEETRAALEGTSHE